MRFKRTLMFVANRLWLILLLYGLSLLMGAYCFSVLESRSLADGLWWAAVTSLTIGYGDITPLTPLGRIAGIAFGHFWIFVVIPMIVANIIIHLVEDKHLFSDEEQRELMQRLKRIEQQLAEGDAGEQGG